MTTPTQKQAGERTQHTPGPWRFIDSHDRRSSGYIRCNRQQVGCAQGVAVARAFQEGVCNWEEYLANARLIAAAPELLAALRISTTTLEVVLDRDSKNLAAKCCIERNKAAIAAAEGRAQ